MLNVKMLVIALKSCVIIANAFLLYYVVDMEKRNCNCSDSWLRDYIKIFSSLLIITFMVLGLVIPSFPYG